MTPYREATSLALFVAPEVCALLVVVAPSNGRVRRDSQSYSAWKFVGGFGVECAEPPKQPMGAVDTTTLSSKTPSVLWFS